MKQKLTTVAVVVLLTLAVATTVFAVYTSVTGVVHDSKTDQPWLPGGTVTVYDCADIGGTVLGSGSISTVDGTFDFPISSSGVDHLCMEIDFNPGPAGEPQTKTLYRANTADADATLDLGTIYTDTGPNAVTFTNVTARSTNVWLPVGIVLGLSALAMGTLILLRKRR